MTGPLTFIVVGFVATLIGLLQARQLRRPGDPIVVEPDSPEHNLVQRFAGTTIRRRWNLTPLTYDTAKGSSG